MPFTSATWHPAPVFVRTHERLEDGLDRLTSKYVEGWGSFDGARARGDRSDQGERQRGEEARGSHDRMVAARSEPLQSDLRLVTHERIGVARGQILQDRHGARVVRGAAPKVPSAWHATARTPASVSFFAAAATTSTLSVASRASSTSTERRRTSELALPVSAAMLETPEKELILDDGGQRREGDRGARVAEARGQRPAPSSFSRPSALAAAARTPASTSVVRAVAHAAMPGVARNSPSA